MNTISTILIVVGLLLCFGSSLWGHFAIHHVIRDMMHSGDAGIGSIVSNLTNAWYLSFVNMVGCVVIFVGLVLKVIAGRKLTNQ